MKTFYMSFCDTNRQEGNQWLGGAIVDGSDPKDAHLNSLLFGCNPGGEVAFLDITGIAHLIKSEYKYKILNKDEIDKAIKSDEFK